MTKKKTPKKSSVKVNDLRSKKDPKGGASRFKIQYEYLRNSPSTDTTTTPVKK